MVSTAQRPWSKLKYSGFLPAILILGVLLVALTGSNANAESTGDTLALEEQALSPDSLSDQRGLADLDMQFQANDGEQNALLQNNALNSQLTGSNSISENAFAGSSGISSVIQNSGNQVIIQDTTMVNVLINQ